MRKRLTIVEPQSDANRTLNAGAATGLSAMLAGAARHRRGLPRNAAQQADVRTVWGHALKAER